MTHITNIRSEVRKVNECAAEVNVSVSIRLDETRADYILTVTKGGCQIERAKK